MNRINEDTVLARSPYCAKPVKVAPDPRSVEIERLEREIDGIRIQIRKDRAQLNRHIRQRDKKLARLKKLKDARKGRRDERPD